MKREEQTRRQFCARTCQLTSLAALGGGLVAALESCGGSAGGPTFPGGVSLLPIVTGSVSGSTITVNTAGTALGAPGTLALVRTNQGDLLVARTAAGAFVALSATCTHQNCEITDFAGETFVCPCHGSQFDTSGRVLQGPAAIPLRTFQTQFASDVLTIAV